MFIIFGYSTSVEKKKIPTQVEKHTMYQSSRCSSTVKSQFRFNKK